jgi:hypothetical protein
MSGSGFLALLGEDGEFVEPSIEVAFRAPTIDNGEAAGRLLDCTGISAEGRPVAFRKAAARHG